MATQQAQVATLIRSQLKAHGIAGTVRSRSASMMTAVDVKLYDAPPWVVKAVREFCCKFKEGSFDGMTDCYNYDNIREDIPQVKFLHVEACYSDELQQLAWDFCRGYWAGMEGAPESQADARNWPHPDTHFGYHGGDYISRALNGTEPFWQKPRRTLAA